MPTCTFCWHVGNALKSKPLAEIRYTFFVVFTFKGKFFCYLGSYFPFYYLIMIFHLKCKVMVNAHDMACFVLEGEGGNSFKSKSTHISHVYQEHDRTKRGNHDIKS